LMAAGDFRGMELRSGGLRASVLGKAKGGCDALQ
jgi:hypothetical protein